MSLDLVVLYHDITRPSPQRRYSLIGSSNGTPHEEKLEGDLDAWRSDMVSFKKRCCAEWENSNLSGVPRGKTSMVPSAKYTFANYFAICLLLTNSEAKIVTQ